MLKEAGIPERDCRSPSDITSMVGIFIVPRVPRHLRMGWGVVELQVAGILLRPPALDFTL